MLRLPLSKICKKCGKTFTTNNKIRKYCSHRCMLAYNKKQQSNKRIKPMVEIRCLYCNKMFILNVKTRKYCSAECREKYYKEFKNKYVPKFNKTVIVKCEICKNEFNKTAKYHVCCSDECREIYKTRNLSAGRFLIFNRDSFTCIYCGRSSIEDNVKLHVDHIVPISKGGKNTADNLVTCCKDCNLEKHNIEIYSNKIIMIISKRNKEFNINDKAKINNNDYINRMNRLSNKSEIKA